MMDRIEHFLSVVKRCDPVEVEGERDNVTKGDIGALAKAYWSLETWEQKRELVNLVQDHIDPQTHEIMIDYLKAPDERGGGNDELIELAKAIALCHLKGSLNDFMTYYNDRSLLAQNIRRYLDKLDEQGQVEQREKPKKWWQFWK